ncbi:MAG: translation machinery-associated protein 20 [Thelocarpon impressellum]|nr:MAG: translation machinery-associated protein 20 [Thelocarpon impressellum]
MFKKDISPGPRSKLKSSAQRAIRAKVLERYPLLAPHIEEVMPKKGGLDVVKLPDRVTLYVLPPATPLWFQHMDDPLLPTLHLAHRFPQCFDRVRVDRGAIRFVLSGASLMVPGLTSPGGRLPPAEQALAKGGVVLIEAEGKDEVCAVGVLGMGTDEMKQVGKGVAVEGGAVIGDGLWRLRLD